MPYTLVIIDVQEKYKDACTPCLISNILQLIEGAKKDGAAIILVEHTCAQNSLPAIKTQVQSYDRHAIVKKEYSDGSDEVLKACAVNNFSACQFRFCGVYSSCCVCATCLGILDKKSCKIEVYADACNDAPSCNEDSQFSWVRGKQNMSLLQVCNTSEEQRALVGAV